MRRIFSPFITTAIVSLMSVMAPCQVPAFGDQGSIEEVPLTQLPSGHLTVDVLLNSQGPYPFVIDTAASHTAIIEPLAVQFGFEPEASPLADVQTLTEEIVTERFKFDSISIASVHGLDIDAVVVGAPMGASLPVLGLLGSDVLEGRRIQINYVDQTLKFGDLMLDHADGRVDPHWNVLIGQGRVSRARQPVRVLVDTGSARTIVNARLARWASRRSASLRVRVGGASRLAETVDSEGVARVNDLRVGGICLPDFMAIEADVDIFRALGWENEPAIILGMDVLQHTVLTIDHGQDVFQLDPADRLGRCIGFPRVQLTPES